MSPLHPTIRTSEAGPGTIARIVGKLVADSAAELRLKAAKTTLVEGSKAFNQTVLAAFVKILRSDEADLKAKVTGDNAAELMLAACMDLEELRPFARLYSVVNIEAIRQQALKIVAAPPVEPDVYVGRLIP